MQMRSNKYNVKILPTKYHLFGGDTGISEKKAITYNRNPKKKGTMPKTENLALTILYLPINANLNF